MRARASVSTGTINSVELMSKRGRIFRIVKRCCPNEPSFQIWWQTVGKLKSVYTRMDTTDHNGFFLAYMQICIKLQTHWVLAMKLWYDAISSHKCCKLSVCTSLTKAVWVYSLLELPKLPTPESLSFLLGNLQHSFLSLSSNRSSNFSWHHSVQTRNDKHSFVNGRHHKKYNKGEIQDSDTGWNTKQGINRKLIHMRKKSPFTPQNKMSEEQAEKKAFSFKENNQRGDK